jgi:hypothetical protein
VFLPKLMGIVLNLALSCKEGPCWSTFDPNEMALVFKNNLSSSVCNVKKYHIFLFAECLNA